MSIVSQTHADQGYIMPSQVVHRVERYSSVKWVSVCRVHLLMHIVLTGLASACHYLSLTYTCHPKTQLTITLTTAGRRQQPEKGEGGQYIAGKMIKVNIFVNMLPTKHF